MEFSFSPIGVIHSCFKEKFGIPRQSGLISEARAVAEILPPYDRDEAFRGLEDFSHIWILFVFHACLRDKWKPTVRPPRLGGNTRMGVFATRSNFRPNPIGLSAVELEKVKRGKNSRLLIHIKGVDLLEGTPVLDIKPYLPYTDSILNAVGGFAPEAPLADFCVEFSQNALEFCLKREKDDIPYLRLLIKQILKNDPRPAYYAQKPQKNIFGTRLFDFDVKWEFENGLIRVLHIEKK